MTKQGLQNQVGNNLLRNQSPRQRVFIEKLIRLCVEEGGSLESDMETPEEA